MLFLGRVKDKKEKKAKKKKVSIYLEKCISCPGLCPIKPLCNVIPELLAKWKEEVDKNLNRLQGENQT